MIRKIAPDKWKHFLVGIGMGGILQAFLFFLLPAHPALAVLIAFLLVAAISYGFELASKITRRGHYDVLDAVASIIGGLMGMGLVVLLNRHAFHTVFL